jgi:hypothetical protein
MPYVGGFSTAIDAQRRDDQTESFIVRDATGQALAYVLFEDEPGRAARLLTFVEAQPFSLLRIPLNACSY